MKFFIATIIVLVISSFDLPVTAQQKEPVQIKRFEVGGPGERKGTAGEILPVPELSALFSEENGTIVVDHILEPQMRAKGYEKTDLQEGDAVLMANGRKLLSVADLKALYDSAAIGTTVKLGVKRKEEMMIASFVKADPEKLPKLRIAVSHGDDEETFILPQAGLIIGEKGKTIVVKEVLQNASGEVHGEVQPGDRIVKFNGSAVQSLKALRSAYEKLPIGSQVQLLTSRSGKNLKVEFTKPKDDGKRIIRRQVSR
jgi:S1-C subfamily serine protease